MANSRFDFQPEKVDINIQELNHKLHLLKKEFFGLCKPFILFLNIASMTIASDQTRNHPEPTWSKVYRIIIIIIALYQCLPMFMGVLYSIQISSPNGTNLSALFYCDNILIVLILINYWINYHEIQNLMNELIMKVCANDLLQSQKPFASISKCSYILLVVGIINLIILLTVVNFEAFIWDNKLNYFLSNFYLLTIPQKYHKLVFTIFQVSYNLSIICVYVFFAFISLVSFMLLYCFKQLNTKLVSEHYLELYQFQAMQTRHQQLAHLVKRTSNTFSPALFLITVVKCIQIIFGVTVIDLSCHINQGASQFIHMIEIGIIYGNAVGIVATLTLLGGKLQNEVSSLNVTYSNNQSVISTFFST